MSEPRFQIDKLCENLGFEFTSHVLRHTFATYGHEYGLDDSAIGRALNQATSGVTGRHYIHSTVEMTKHIFEKIEEQILFRAFEEPVRSKLNASEVKTLDDVEAFYTQQAKEIESIPFASELDEDS